MNNSVNLIKEITNEFKINLVRFGDKGNAIKYLYPLFSANYYFLNLGVTKADTNYTNLHEMN